jgi:hypothetical protein
MRSHIRVRVAMTFVAPLIAIGAARAQDPVALPAVISRAAPGPKLMVGVVRDTASVTIDGVEVLIPALRRRTHSRTDGVFRFDSLPNGTYEVHARRLGYAPQVRTIVVDSIGGTGDFELVPIDHVLPAVVSTVGRGGLSGVVGDTSFAGLRGVTVHIAGAGLTTETDVSGAFYVFVKPGRYNVSFVKEGFRQRVASVVIPSDSGRHITEFLTPVGDVPVKEAWNIVDLNERMATVSNRTKNGFYTRDELEKAGIEWVFDAVQMTSSRLGFRSAISDKCHAVLNGGPSIAVLNTITVDQIESVEVYGQQAAPKGRSRDMRTLPFGPMANSFRAQSADQGLICPVVYVWMR